uniref:phenylalanine--tRNA ligase n=1 Tax=Thuretia quercifolia TaxID=189650 RepID=A0A1Z1ML43_9FLOR|nr:Phenylalanine-tRNA ligase beta subunit [Thuretia quercifolia]ARW66515.1 Phenylalanine-tRNA ligase beta subunit [Thuretia quercifolia]
MKFSWNILNYFINLNSINFKDFTNKLILSGFEIEEIENQLTTKDKIINLDITANRKDIHCIFNMAKEISIVCNLPLKIPILNTNSKYNNKIKRKNNFITKSNVIRYIQINTIHSITNDESPIWLKNHLQSYDIKSSYLLHDIQSYIKLKWGHEFFIYDIKENNSKIINTNLLKIQKYKEDNKKEKILYINKELINFNNYHIFKEKKFNYKTRNIILCFICYKEKSKVIKNLEENLENAHYETIQMIQTFSKGIINVSHKYFNDNKNLSFKYELELKQDYIKKILGPIRIKNKKFLSNKQIFYSLKQLKIEPKYIKKHKNFRVLIPEYRNKDIYRNIDLIEEIGRIYGFNNFLNKIPKYNQKGKISSRSFYIKKIRNTLKILGFNEVINSSLTNKIINNDIINIYNPLTKEHKFLRTNIINNLIKNYQNNNKQKNTRTEIFEIGQIFYRESNNKYIEETHLGILTKNKGFIKENWSNSSKSITLFHIKGIFEIFFQKLSCNIIWENLDLRNYKSNLKQIGKILNQKKVIEIYNKNNRNLIGIFGELNYRLNDIKYKGSNNTYILELNLNELIKTIEFNKHLKYNIRSDSIYPSVIRDISINITKEQKVCEIEKLIKEQNNEFLESIELINAYEYNKNNNINKGNKSICLRIIYRSKNKTLNTKDIKKVDENIEKILNKFKLLQSSNIKSKS